MTGFLLLVLAVLGLVGFLALFSRVRELEREVRSLRRYEAPREPAPEPVRTEPQPVAAVEPARVEIPVSPPEFVPVHEPFGARVRSYVGQESWEVMVGGSLLNKIGALVLVIGLALFLVYSFSNMSPGGRALTCAGISWALLLSGVLIERKPAYQVFARGLIGAGWAALYVTAYAIYAVPAARLIANPYLGSVLLLIVAAGMIGHSLHYRRQAVTAVAYFAAFAALGVTPWSTFGFVGLLPLAISLLWIAVRLNWNAMSLFGVIVLYATCIWRGRTESSLFAAQALLLVYWLIFEMFDVMRARRDKSGGGIEYVFPINATGFLLLSYEAWNYKDPGDMWIFCCFGVALFAVSAVARWFVRRQDRTAEMEDVASRLQRGSFELPITVAAVMGGLAITLRAVGVWLGAGLAIEAEALYLAGVGLNSVVLRGLGRAGFSASLVRVVSNDFGQSQISQGILRGLHSWTPISAFLAFLLYLNRAIRKPNAVMSSVATALIAWIIMQDARDRYIGALLMLFAYALFEAGLRKDGKDFRFQAYAVAFLGAFASQYGSLAVYEYLRAAPPGYVGHHYWDGALFAIFMLYALFFRSRATTFLEGREKVWFHSGLATVIAFTSLLWSTRFFGFAFVPASWTVLAVVLLLLGRRGFPPRMQFAAYLVEGLAFLTCLRSDLTWWVALGAAGCYAAEFDSRRFEESEPKGRTFWSIAGTLTVTALIWAQVSGRVMTVAWGIEGITILAVGFVASERILRLQGLVLFAACILKLFLYDLRNLQTGPRILSFIALGVILLGVSSIYSRFRSQIRKHL